MMIETMKKFCTDYESRFNTDKLFVRCGYCIATDAAILIATPSTEDDSDFRTPDVNNIIKELQSVNDWCGFNFTVPHCSKCDDKYQIGVKCETCDGTGEVEHECDCEYCDLCEEECLDCDGTGGIVDCDCSNVNIEIAGRSIAIKYAKLISELPNLEVSPGGGRLRFKFDEGFGMVMERDKHA